MVSVKYFQFLVEPTGTKGQVVVDAVLCSVLNAQSVHFHFLAQR